MKRSSNRYAWRKVTLSVLESTLSNFGNHFPCPTARFHTADTDVDLTRHAKFCLRKKHDFSRPHGAQPSLTESRLRLLHFKKVISFPDSLYFLDNESTMFKDPPELKIGFGARYGMNNPFDSRQIS